MDELPDSDPIRVVVITLSDRASTGQYADRSGPRIVSRLRGYFEERDWAGEIQCAVLPDAPELLGARLESARDSGIDVVFTTGGTGVGPRDRTPDVVRALADRELPGIMEYIRVKYGAHHPNALLSRSVAAVLGSMLVFTLPGSVKAVDEYLDEILRVLSHLLIVIRGKEAHGDENRDPI